MTFYVRSFGEHTVLSARGHAEFVARELAAAKAAGDEPLVAQLAGKHEAILAHWREYEQAEPLLSAAEAEYREALVRHAAIRSLMLTGTTDPDVARKRRESVADAEQAIWAHQNRLPDVARAASQPLHDVHSIGNPLEEGYREAHRMTRGLVDTLRHFINGGSGYDAPDVANVAVRQAEIVRRLDGERAGRVQIAVWWPASEREAFEKLDEMFPRANLKEKARAGLVELFELRWRECVGNRKRRAERQAAE